MHAAGRRVEASDAVIEPGRINECMFVRTGHLDAVIVVGNDVTTHDAHERAFAAVDLVIHLFR